MQRNISASVPRRRSAISQECPCLKVLRPSIGRHYTISWPSVELLPKPNRGRVLGPCLRSSNRSQSWQFFTEDRLNPRNVGDHAPLLQRSPPEPVDITYGHRDHGHMECPQEHCSRIAHLATQKRGRNHSGSTCFRSEAQRHCCHNLRAPPTRTTRDLGRRTAMKYRHGFP